jgi:hypothetical protein
MRRPCGGEVEGQGPPASPVRRTKRILARKMLIDGVPANRLDFGNVIPFTDEIFRGRGCLRRARRDAAE